jgi:hypothetical protein
LSPPLMAVDLLSVTKNKEVAPVVLHELTPNGRSKPTTRQGPSTADEAAG